MRGTGPIPVRKSMSTSPGSANTRATARGSWLFDLKRKPWIAPDEVDAETVMRVIDTCPSGALKYRQNKRGTAEILEGHNKFYVNDAEGNQVAEIVFVPDRRASEHR